jgi:Sensors of blue-light using FAD
MVSLIHCIYASAPVQAFDDSSLRDLLCQARLRNTRDNVSGMLLYTANSFFQVLEGESDSVDATFDRIARDTRHDTVTLIIREPIARRSFEDWSMGYTSVSHEELGAIVGQNDFFDKGNCYTSLGDGRAKKILRAFAKGRWRAQLDSPLAA